MKNTIKKCKIKKVLIISMTTLIVALLTVALIGYLTLRGFIRKMNLVEIDWIQEDYTAYLDDYEEITYDNEIYVLNDENQHTFGTQLAITEDKIDGEGKDDISILSVNNNVSDIPIMEDKDVLNILLIGSDARDTKSRGRSDAMMILSINKKKEAIILTSLLRDIYLDIPGKTGNRLNAAYAIGGPRLLMETIEHNFRIKLDKYISVDFFAFMEIIDAIGGVTVEISDKELEYMNKHISEINRILKEDKKNDLLNSSGEILLNGKQTLGFSRLRYIGTDFARTARQRKVMEQIFKKLKNIGFNKLIDILNIVLPKVTTNFKESEIISHVLRLPDYLGYEFVQWSIPEKGSYSNEKIKGMAVLLIDFEENINQIFNKIYLTE